MRRLGCSVMPRVAAPKALAATVAAPQAVAPQRNLEFLSTYWLASWSMIWQWNFFTCFPLVAMDLFKPSVVVNKAPLLHYFHEKRQEIKLQKALDQTVTEWTDELETANIDDAISRTF